MAEGSYILLFTGAEESGPIVQTHYGSVQGKLQYAADSTKPISTFLNIPYAAPPVGKNRFLKPQPLEPWTGTRDATKIGKNIFLYNIVSFI